LVVNSVGDKGYTPGAEGFYQNALGVIENLYSEAGIGLVENAALLNPIVFLARDIGASLVKQVISMTPKLIFSRNNT
jgi:hypothetical protein